MGDLTDVSKAVTMLQLAELYDIVDLKEKLIEHIATETVDQDKFSVIVKLLQDTEEGQTRTCIP